MSELIALSAVGLGFMLLVGIAAAFVLYLVVSRLFRRPPPPPPAVLAAAPIQPAFLEPFRQAQAVPPQSLLDGMIDYGNQRRTEIERDKYRGALDGILGIVGAGPVAPPNA